MANYRLPDFNLTMQYSWDGVSPADGAIFRGPYPCQKYINTRNLVGVGFQPGYAFPYSVQFRVPLSAWIDEGLAIPEMCYWTLSFIELAPFGNGRTYRILNWEIAHEGFPNAYGLMVAYPVIYDSAACFLYPGSAGVTSYPAGYPYLMGDNS